MIIQLMIYEIILLLKNSVQYQNENDVSTNQNKGPSVDNGFSWTIKVKKKKKTENNLKKKEKKKKKKKKILHLNKYYNKNMVQNIIFCFAILSWEPFISSAFSMSIDSNLFHFFKDNYSFYVVSFSVY